MYVVQIGTNTKFSQIIDHRVAILSVSNSLFQIFISYDGIRHQQYHYWDIFIRYEAYEEDRLIVALYGRR